VTSATGAPGAETGRRLALAREIADRYAVHEEVEAVAIGGSVASGFVTDASDIDLYVYLRAELSLATRAEIAGTGSTHAEVANAFWESGDEWYDDATGIAVDVILRDPAWIEGQLDRVWSANDTELERIRSTGADRLAEVHDLLLDELERIRAAMPPEPTPRRGLLRKLFRRGSPPT